VQTWGSTVTGTTRSDRDTGPRSTDWSSAERLGCADRQGTDVRVERDGVGIDACPVIRADIGSGRYPSRHGRYRAAPPDAVDLDLGTGGRFSSPGRRRCDDPGGERKVVGLDHDGIPRSELFVPTGIARSSETVEVTTHERQPSLRPVPPMRQRPLRHCGVPRPRRVGARAASHVRPAESPPAPPPTGRTHPG